jgi:hypothetical protein
MYLCAQYSHGKKIPLAHHDGVTTKGLRLDIGRGFQHDGKKGGQI